MIRTQVQLTEEQDRRLEELAATQRVSKAQLVRRAVDLLLQQESRSDDLETKWARALAVVGCFQGDGANVAVKHDKYLAEAYADWKREGA